MSSKGLQTNYIVQDEGICGGKPRIAGTRMKVAHIVMEYFDMGWSVKRICAEHPRLTHASVHAALSFYYDHQDEIKRDIREGQEYAERMEAGLI